jgi:hypothetical protein
MDIQLVAALIGFGAWVLLFIYGAVDSCLNPEPVRIEPRPRPRYPKGR